MSLYSNEHNRGSVWLGFLSINCDTNANKAAGRLKRLSPISYIVEAYTCYRFKHLWDCIFLWCNEKLWFDALKMPPERCLIARFSRNVKHPIICVYWFVSTASSLSSQALTFVLLVWKAKASRPAWLLNITNNSCCTISSAGFEVLWHFTSQEMLRMCFIGCFYHGQSFSCWFLLLPSSLFLLAVRSFKQKQGQKPERANSGKCSRWLMIRVSRRI